MSSLNYNDENWLSMILNNMDIAVCLVGRSGKLLYCNNVYLQILKCDKEMVMRTYGDMKNNVGSGLLNRSFALETIETGKKVKGCQKLYDINGNPQYLYATHIPIYGSAGEVQFSLALIQYVEKLKQNYFDAIVSLEKVVGPEFHQVNQDNTDIICESVQMKRILSFADNIADTDAAVLLQGDSGTGKEVFANYIHKHSHRADKAMVNVNCASVPADLFEAELFGYVGGAFTGASKSGKKGLIEEADGGTLFLDEINSMPLTLQSKLLRAIEQKTIQRIGSNEQRHVDFRLISAANSDLLQLVSEGSFRLDLYFRLNVTMIKIPALRERTEDIALLAGHFMNRFREQYSREKVLAESALEQLQNYSWPGNVRELKNVIERIFILSSPSDKVITNIADYFFMDSSKTEIRKTGKKASLNHYLLNEMSLQESVEFYERNILREALEKYSSLSEVEMKLGISRATLFRKMKKYNMRKYYQ